MSGRQHPTLCRMLTAALGLSASAETINHRNVSMLSRVGQV